MGAGDRPDQIDGVRRVSKPGDNSQNGDSDKQSATTTRHVVPPVQV